jgi:hypothetical protein
MRPCPVPRAHTHSLLRAIASFRSAAVARRIPAASTLADASPIDLCRQPPASAHVQPPRRPRTCDRQATVLDAGARYLAAGTGASSLTPPGLAARRRATTTGASSLTPPLSSVAPPPATARWLTPAPVNPARRQAPPLLQQPLTPVPLILWQPPTLTLLSNNSRRWRPSSTTAHNRVLPNGVVSGPDSSPPPPPPTLSFTPEYGRQGPPSQLSVAKLLSLSISVIAADCFKYAMKSVGNDMI